MLLNTNCVRVFIHWKPLWFLRTTQITIFCHLISLGINNMCRNLSRLQTIILKYFLIFVINKQAVDNTVRTCLEKWVTSWSHCITETKMIMTSLKHLILWDLISFTCGQNNIIKHITVLPNYFPWRLWQLKITLMKSVCEWATDTLHFKNVA